MEMNLSIKTICLICFISNGLAKLPSIQESEDSQLPPIPPQFPIYYSEEALTNTTNFKHEEKPTFFDSIRSQRSYLTRDRSYERPYYDNYPNRYENENSDFPKQEVRVFRTYGRGKAQVTRQGPAVNVPNELGRLTNKPENEMKVRHRVICRECPTDQTVVASKGNEFSILPEPCPMNPKMWNHIDGPRPGSKVQEGLHWIRGYIGPKKKFCQYHYRVLVNRCDPLRPRDRDTTIECSSETIWGSVCNVSCGDGKEPLGPTNLECKEDLTWSSPIPTCKNKLDCTTPKVKTNSKISCQTADMVQYEGDVIPNGSTCKFMQNEKKVSINCKDGRWRMIRKNKAPLPKKIKMKSKPTPEKSDVCDTNPCQNGGTCLRAEPNKGDFVCRCRPQTQGTRCEMRECYYNICENNGVCFLQNEQQVCYCPSEYNGETCQYYNPKY